MLQKPWQLVHFTVNGATTYLHANHEKGFIRTFSYTYNIYIYINTLFTRFCSLVTIHSNPPWVFSVPFGTWAHPQLHGRGTCGIHRLQTPQGGAPNLDVVLTNAVGRHLKTKNLARKGSPRPQNDKK